MIDNLVVVRSLGALTHELGKAVDAYVSCMDARQFTLAAINVGRMEQIGLELERVAFLARQVVADLDALQRAQHKEDLGERA